jgi:hypothetical protein
MLAVGLVAGCAAPGRGAVAGAVGTPDPTVVAPGSSPSAAPVLIPIASAATGATGSPPIGGASLSPAATVLPTPPAAPSPTPTPSPSPTPVPSGPYAMNLYGKGDFVSQANVHQCVSAAMQIMLNVIGPRNDRTKATQATLARLAKRLSDHPDGGTEPRGWARGLERRGAGDYAVAVESTRTKAIRRAVEAIRATGRPVGLLVWRGAHSWVLHGFTATADPALTDDYKVTGLWVSDPWYPRISSIWGPSRKPNQKITPKQLTEDYLKWRRPTGRYPGMDGRFVLIVPVPTEAG